MFLLRSDRLTYRSQSLRTPPVSKLEVYCDHIHITDSVIMRVITDNPAHPLIPLQVHPEASGARH
jgi:hypothetical protein